jgi:CspA family cold shock protein
MQIELVEKAAPDDDVRIVLDEAQAEVAAISSGAVVKYDPRRGFGFIRGDSDGRDIFFHISSLKRGALPVPGARVRYVAERGPKGLQGTRVQLT